MVAAAAAEVTVSPSTDLDIHVNGDGCTLTLPFGITLVASQLPFSISLPLWNKASKSKIHRPPALLTSSKPHELTTLAVCDASSGEFLPSNCGEGSSTVKQEGGMVTASLVRRGEGGVGHHDSVLKYRDDEEQETWAESEEDLGHLESIATRTWTIVVEEGSPYGWVGGEMAPSMPRYSETEGEEEEEEGEGHGKCVTGSMRCSG
ncbi:hypothetical protein GGI23_007885, partial [Coemansia sp. RSA 2559]